MFMSSFLGLGMDAHYRGQFDEAKFYFSEGLKIAQRLNSSQMILVMESELAHLVRVQGDLQQAKGAYRRLIGKWKERGQYSAVAHQLECFALIALQQSEPQRAARLFGAAEVLREQIQIFRHGFEKGEYQQALTALRGQLDAAAFTSAWADGRALDMERAIQYAVTPGEEAK
jgi:tetratricopeptide (TPR) repeat protein